jgi:hypothetical protein
VEEWAWEEDLRLAEWADPRNVEWEVLLVVVEWAVMALVLLVEDIKSECFN